MRSTPNFKVGQLIQRINVRERTCLGETYLLLEFVPERPWQTQLRESLSGQTNLVGFWRAVKSTGEVIEQLSDNPGIMELVS